MARFRSQCPRRGDARPRHRVPCESRAVRLAARHSWRVLPCPVAQYVLFSESSSPSPPFFSEECSPCPCMPSNVTRERAALSSQTIIITRPVLYIYIYIYVVSGYAVSKLALVNVMEYFGAENPRRRVRHCSPGIVAGTEGGRG